MRHPDCRALLGSPMTNRMMTTSDQIDLVLSIDQSESGQSSLLRALVNCLTPAQSVDLFWKALDGRRELIEA